MSVVTICDICGERVGLAAVPVLVAGPTHPHSMERVYETETIDACRHCLAHVPDLSCPHDLDSLQRRERIRRAVTNPEN
jgi:hypothetical protein